MKINTHPINYNLLNYRVLSQEKVPYFMSVNEGNALKHIRH